MTQQEYNPQADGSGSYLAAIEAKRQAALSAIKREVVIGDCRLLLGDCLEIMPSIGAIHAVVTDPPYGVGLGSRDNNNRERFEYKSFEDTPENVSRVAVPAIELGRNIAQRVVLTPGVRNVSLYPKPDHMGAIYYPAGAGCNVWGFSCWQPILYYGKDPYGGSGSRPDSFHSTESAEKNGHPCPKPIGQMRRIVDRATKAGEIALDPFMGSGTTGVACVKLGRKFIGIEIDEGYFDIACDRIRKAYAQPDMFIEARSPEPVQEGLPW